MPTSNATLNATLPENQTAIVDKGGLMTPAFRLFLSKLLLALPIRGNGDPTGVITSPAGTIYLNLDGGAGTAAYLNEDGTSAGWVPLP